MYLQPADTQPVEGRNSRSRRSRGVAVIAGFSLVATLVAFGLAFTNAASARRVSETSQKLQWANASSGSLALSRAALFQAVVFSVDARLGVATQEAEALAHAEAVHTLDVLDGWIEATPASEGDLASALRSLHSIGDEVVERLGRGDVAEGDRVLAEQFEPAYATLTADLAAVQESFGAEISKVETDAGRIERLTQLLVTLFIPLVAIALHRLITRRQYREHRVRLNAKLEAEKELNRSKDRFIAGLSHELRTPLTSIYGFSEHLLDQGLIDPDEAIELISLINHDSAELTRMVEDLLAAARLEAGTLHLDPVDVDLGAVAAEAAGRLRDEGIHVRIEGVAPPRAWADRDGVSHIIRNLCSNAVRYGGEQREVVVEGDGRWSSISIVDDGPGVPEELADRMFDRFLNEGERTLLNGSLGLGLSVAHGIAAEMGGSLEYERRDGRTTFLVRLPTEAGEDQHDGPDDSAAALVAAGGHLGASVAHSMPITEPALHPTDSGDHE